MSLPGTYSGQILSTELDLSEGEKELWDNAQSTTDHSIILFSKTIKKLSDSNNKNAKAMTIFTGGLLLVAVVQICILVFQ
jgi:hypothetical protein